MEGSRFRSAATTTNTHPPRRPALAALRGRSASPRRACLRSDSHRDFCLSLVSAPACVQPTERNLALAARRRCRRPFGSPASATAV